MVRVLKYFVYGLMALWLTACGGGGGSAGTPGGSANPSNFKVNAPSDVTLAVGQKVTYSITGGLTPYQVNNSAPNVVSAFISGSNVVVEALRTGSGTVTVSPSGGGASYPIAFTVSTSANPLRVDAPDTVTLRLGNSASYRISGGTAPYRAVSSASGVLSASIDGDRLSVRADALGAASVLIFDAANSTPLGRDFSVITSAQLFSTAPSSLSLVNGSPARSYEVRGGVPPYSASSSNPAVVDVNVDPSNGRLTISPQVTSGTGAIVIRDSSGSSISIDVTVGATGAFFTDAPSDLTIFDRHTYRLGGGTAPYRVVSSNDNVVTAAMSSANSNEFVLNAVGRGTATVRLSDARGASISLAITVIQGTGTSVGGVELTSNRLTLRTNGETADLAALVKGSNNVALAGVDVSYQTTSGILSNVESQTGTNGIAKATLSVGSNRLNRDITVTATVGSRVGTLRISATGSTVSFTEGKTTVLAGATAERFTVRALDAGNAPIVGVALVGSSSLGNALTPVTAQTDANGYQVFSYVPTRSGRDTLTVSTSGSAGNLTGQQSVEVSPIEFSFFGSTPAESTVFGVNQATSCSTVGATAPLCVPEFRLRVRVNGQVPVTPLQVRFSTSRGTLNGAGSTVVIATDGAGEAVASLTSNSAGTALVTAQADVPVNGAVVRSSDSRSVLFTGITPAAVRVQANPSSIPPNVGGVSSSRSTVTAMVTDSSGNPIANRLVLFNLIADPSNGSLSNGATETNSLGQANVEYIAGANSSPTNGVVIEARVPALRAGEVERVSAPNANLTVSGNALFISIGVSNTIENENAPTYRKPFSVYVTDASGLPVANRDITLSVIPTKYRKGSLAYNGTVWTYNPGRPEQAGPPVVPAIPASPTASCDSEDQLFGSGDVRRNNGVLDAGEDVNLDGRLTPGNIAIASPGTVTTNSGGLATFNVLYGEQYAVWVDVEIVATATVAGTETRSVLPYGLVGASEDFTKEDNPPAARTSPFGTATVCSSKD
jgi:hypothetical protein